MKLKNVGYRTGLLAVALLGGTQVYAGTVASLPSSVGGLGQPLSSEALDSFRGGFDVVKNDMLLSGSVADNTAAHVNSGGNYVGQGVFNNASGLPTVIQNSGSNVLIQNATIINVQFQ
jgi:hypothetical protein